MPDLFHHPLFARVAVLAVLVLGLVAFVPGISSIPPMDRDESRFAQASKQMVESGDLVTVRYQQDLRAKKPVGIYWMQASAAAILGTETIAPYRLPSLIAAFVIALAGFHFAATLMETRLAAVAAVMMASSLVLAAEAHLAKTDAALAASVLIQQMALWRIYRHCLDGDYVTGKLALLFWGAMAASILLKGPIGPLIALLTITVLCLHDRSWRWLHGLRPVLGFITLTVIVLPWVLLVTHATDGAFLATAIKGDLISKIKTGQESHGAPPLTHLALLVVTFWPASLLLVRGGIMVLQRWRDRAIIFLLGWLVPFWLVIELTPTKLPHYFLPVMPALAMLVALGIDYRLPPRKALVSRGENEAWQHFGLRWLRGLHPLRVLIRAWEAVFVLASLGLGVFVLYGATDLGGNRGWGLIALLLAVLVAGLAVWWVRIQKPAILVLMALAACGFHGVTFGGVMPSLADMHLAPRLKAEIATLDEPVESIAAAGYHEPSMVFTLGTDTLLFTGPEAALFLAEAPNGLAIVETRARPGFIDTATRAGIGLRQVGAIDGYNASRGQRVTLEFWRAED